MLKLGITDVIHLLCNEQQPCTGLNSNGASRTTEHPLSIKGCSIVRRESLFGLDGHCHPRESRDMSFVMQEPQKALRIHF